MGKAQPRTEKEKEKGEGTLFLLLFRNKISPPFSSKKGRGRGEKRRTEMGRVFFRRSPEIDNFFFWGGSLFGPRPIRIRILMPSPYSYLPELATTDRIAGALHTGAHLSSLRHCLQGRPTLFSPKGEPTFLPLGM